MKRTISFLIALLVFLSSFSMLLSAQENSANENFDFTSRKDFLWGQNLHNASGYNSPDRNSEERVHYVAKQGVKLIRYQGNDITEDFDEMDRIVSLCNAYGMKVMLLIKPPRQDEPTQEDLDYITTYAKTYAERYNGKEGRGKVDYFQLWNEQQIALRKSKYGDGGAVDGSSKGHYYDVSVAGKQDLVEYTKYFKAAIKGIKAADTDAKTLINFPRTAWGDILYYAENGVEFDGLAWNFYPDGLDPEAARKQFYEAMYGGVDEEGNPVLGLRQLFPDKEVIISEANTCINKIPDYNNVTIDQYDAFVEVMKLAYQQDWIKGLCAFQMTCMVSHPQEAERHYGHLLVDSLGNIIEPKPIYYLYQKLIGGSNSIPLIKKSSIDLAPYEKFKVKTQDDTELNQSEQVKPPADDNVSSQEKPVVDKKPTTQENESTIKDESNVDENSSIKSESIVEIKEIVDTVTVKPDDQYKKTTSTITQNKLPWILIISVGVGMLVLFGGGVAAFVIIDKKKLKKNDLIK